MTQQSLMDAAEKLVAKNGIHSISIKEIVKEAGQKNESALQYHFKNLPGILKAIHNRRHIQTQTKRAQLIKEIDAKHAAPSLRALCGLMVLPTFYLAREDAKYRRYIAGFSHEIAVTEDSALNRVNKSGGGGESGHRTGELLRQTLSHLDEPSYRQRMEFAIRMSSAAMGHHAKQKNAFKGLAADQFVSNLIDALEGLLNAPVSSETQSLQ